VVLGVALFAGMFNAYLNLGSSLESSYARLGMADMTVTNPDDGFVDTARGLLGVAEAIERRQADVPVEIGDRSLIGRVIGMPGDGQPAINKVDMVKGEYLDSDDESGVLVEEHAAGDFELAVGDTFEIVGQEVTVRGIAVSPEYLWPAKDRQTVFTPPRTFAVVFANQSILEDLQGQAIEDQVLVIYEDDVIVEDVDSAVESAAGAANAADIQTLADQPSNATINEEIGGLQTMAVALPLLFLAAAGMAIYVVITRLVYSQRGVIGTLRATGFGAKTLSRHYLSYGVGVGLVGAAVGAVLGGLMGWGMTAIYTAVFGIPDLVAPLHLPTVLLALLFGAGAGAIAAVPPARIVAAMPPAEAMRGETPAQGGKRSIFETLIPPLRRAPVRWRMTLRGLGRNKRRSLAMVVGVILSAVMILATAGSMDTMLSAFDRQFNEVAIEDAHAFFSVPVGDSQVDDVASATGIMLAEPVIGLSATIRNGSASYTTLLEGYERGTQVHGFASGLPQSGVLLGQAMQDLLDVEIGQRVTVEFPDLGMEISVLVQEFVDEPMATLAYMEANALVTSINEVDEAITGDVLSLPSFTTVKARYEPGASGSLAVSAIRDVEGVAAVIDTTELRDLLAQFQAFFYVFIGMGLVFGGAMAFALIFNIISVNVAERVGEFASMRANGLTHRRVASMITGETFLLTAIGIVPGLVAGYWAAVAFMNSFSSDQFPIVAEVRPWTFVLTALGLLAVAGISLIPAVRAVKRINVGEVVRERAI
ncbi:MAG: FtsX-like permease family protein, partial [Acidimicrobiia bacterium]